MAHTERPPKRCFAFASFAPLREMLQVLVAVLRRYESRDKIPVAMPFNAHLVYANLVEKERVKGHHSPEGRAIRVLSRALSGWSSSDLSARDVVVLCDQAVEDWLKARLKRSPWSAQTKPALLVDALKNRLINRMDAVRLQRIANLRARWDNEAQISKAEVETALEFCIQLMEKDW